MKVKTANIMCIIALAAQILSTLFLFLLLCMGKLSPCFGNSSDINEAVGATCVAFILILFIVIGMVAQIASVIAGGASVFTGKRKLSVAVATVFVIVLCASAILIYVYALTMLATAKGDSGAIALMAVAFCVDIAVCAYMIVAYILAAIAKSKKINLKKREAKEKGEDGKPVIGSSDDDAEEATYTVVTTGEDTYNVGDNKK